MSDQSRVFISYRRNDSAGHAGRLRDALVSRFGEASVFMDVDAIGPGADFADAIEDAIGRCDVFVALIGKAWLTAVTAEGRRRLDDARDVVRLEIEAALAQAVRVIPVLVEGAVPPAADELPGAIADLARRNAVELSDSRWHYDVVRLLETIEEGEGDVFPPVEPEVRLPVPATPFVGREREIEEVSELLRSSNVRLLTLTGPGGMGKTRLALEAARAAAWRFPDGITWVGLSASRDPALVVSQIAEALEVEEEAAQPILQTVAAALAGRQALLLLDNFEQLLPDGAAAVTAILDSCPSISVLVTSRERLQLAAEHVYPVPPLQETDAADLFCQRALAHDPGFMASPAVSELCAKLDQLPLALELAAARTPVFTPEQLLGRLSKRLDLLRAGRDADPRQQTLRATLVWSHELLTESEQRLFARLSIFAGGCTLEAAEQVCEADFDLLQSLLDKSLLRRRSERFWMLATIREFAGERMEATGEAGAVRQSHAEYYLDLAEEAGDAVHGGHDQALWLTRVEAEQDNFRAASRQLAESGDAERDLRLATVVATIGLVQGRFLEAEHRLVEALDRSHSQPAALRAKALEAAGALALSRGDYDRASTCLTESVAIARRLGDLRRLPRSLGNLGAVAIAQGDWETARSHYEAALALYREQDDASGVGSATGNLGYVDLCRGEYARAEELLQGAAAVLRAADDHAALATMLHNLALTALEQGDRRRGSDFAKEAIELAAGLGRREVIWDSLEALAALDDSPERAARLLGVADALRESDGASLYPFEQAIHDRTLDALRAQLAEEAFERAWEEGAAMTMDDAVAYALSEAT